MNKYSGMKLSEVPFEDITIGMKVISVLDTPGTIMELITCGFKGEANFIEIDWDNGRSSDGRHNQMKSVTVK